MKRLITMMLLLVAAAATLSAYDRVIVERHSFRFNYPDNYNIKNTTITWGGLYNSCLLSIKQTNDWRTCDHGQDVVAEATYYSYLDHQARFLVENTGGWKIQTNDRPDLGVGLVNTDGSARGFKILGLKAGDVVRFEYYRKQSGGDFPTYKSGSCAARQTNGSSVVSLSNGSAIRGTDDIFIDSNGDLDLNVPSQVLIRQITITLAEYKKASYLIEEVTKSGNKGYKYTLTGSGVLEEKRGAVPYITMRFGHDDDMTIVKDLGSGNYGASCIVDPSHNLNIEDASVKLSANYKHRYQNKNGNYVAYQTYSNSSQYNNSYNQYDEWATSDANVKNLAQTEVNGLKGTEWTVFQCETEWNADHNWAGKDGSPIGSKSRSYKWEDNFSTIWPQYGTYFYFFPEVKGKLSVKFYCEGAHQHMPFWWKAQDDGSGELIIKDQFVTGRENGDGYIYEYNDIEVARGGAYYLCANPTLVSREHPVVRLISYEFIPEFRVEPLYKVVENGTREVTTACTIKGGPFSDLTVDKTRTIKVNGEDAPEVKFLGNIADADFSITGSGSEQYLNISNIRYKDEAGINSDANHGGVIVVNLHCDAGKATFVLTVAYDAVEATMDGASRNSTSNAKVKKWDFYTEELAVGQYKNGSGTYPSAEWTNSSTLYKEVNKFDGMTTDWTFEYLNRSDPNNLKEPIFKSVYDMEGDNADMLVETEGLIFLTESNLLGIYNENETYATTGQFQDRYIGLMGESDLSLDEHPRAMIIPYLEAGDRIVIKMGRYGNSSEGRDAILKITGAKDAIGQPITADYIIGGSHELDGAGQDHSKPYAEYHFIANGPTGDNPNGDFKLEVKDARLLKLYNIEIYRNALNDNADILTENNVLGTNRGVLYTDKQGEADKQMSINLHYFGLAERMRYISTTHKTNKFKEVEPNFTTTDNLNFRYTPTHEQFGSFRSRLGCQTRDNAYITDYADYQMAVGYRQTMQYPYTWDFTDLKKYVMAAATIDADGNEVGVSDPSLRVWDAYGMRVMPEGCSGCLFVKGGQLFADTKMFDETRGIGVFPYNYDVRRNKVLTMDGNDSGIDGGLVVKDNRASETSPIYYGFIVPELAANQAIYVCAEKAEGAKTSQAKYAFTKGTFNANTGEEQFNEEINFAFVGTNAEGYDVFAMKKAADAATGNVKLSFQGYEVKRIAVATDEKKVNIKGYASESRNHDIDAKLLPYFTGEDFKTYIVSNPDYDKLTLTLTDIGSTDANHVLQAYTGCVIRRVGEGDDLAFNVFNDGKGFHLFVPDMHDQIGKFVTVEDKTVNDGFMIPVLAEMQVPYTNNYVTLSHGGFNDAGAVWYAYTWNTDDDKIWVPETSGGRFIGLKDKVIFVRMNPACNGNPSWNYKWNQTDDLTVQKGKTYTITAWNNGDQNGNLIGNWSAGQTTDTDMTNYVLTYNYKKLNGTNLSATISGEEKFYRVYSGWDIWLRANSAYLQLPTASVLSDNAPRAARMFSFFFADANNEQETTAIDDLEGMAAGATPVDVTDNNAVWYNIYGQRLGSRPTQRGVYIVNGKKVTVK